jgi:hypothetical protein
MRTIILYGALAVTIALAGARLLAQEMIATPDPVGGAQVQTGANVSPGVPTQSGPAADRWRYRQFNGRWWYWTPQKRWMWYSDDGRWVEFDPNHGPPVAVQGDGNPPGYGGYYYAPGPGYYYYPGPRYWSGYYPGVAVGVGPYGDVGVGVGRRVGVDVWGPHGGVRVGRIHVGW